jgi:hypothetical protein
MKYKQKTTRGVCCIIAVLLFGVSLFFPKDSFAVVTTLFQEDFTYSLRNSWKVVWNQQWGDVGLPCLNGSLPATWQQHAGKLGIVIDSPPCVIDLAPSALNLQKVGQYTVHFSVDMNDTTWMNRSVAVLWQDPQNWYDIMVFADTIYVQKYINGQYSTLAGPINYPFQTNQTYSFSVEVIQGQSIEVGINSQTVLVALDKPPFLTPLQKKTVAFRGSTGAISRSSLWFDNFKITADLEPSELISLNVPLFKQTDPRWREQEYDSAKKWSDAPTIGRWGCAMTSMAMILQYHGISQLPDGKVITPETLNQWLKDQPDGYISGGINWLAITRLTRLISEKHRTPKLEFSRSSGKKEDVIKWATQEIEKDKPVILGVPGHFFVADGINTAAETLLIKDPAFNYELLSQHKTEVESIRRFQPSQTDLSYILFVVPKGLSLQVKDQSGQILPVERSSEYIESFSDDVVTGDVKQSPVVEQVLLKKPANENYSVHLSQVKQMPYQLKIYSYDVLGNVQVQEKNGQVGSAGTHFSLNYQKGSVTQSPRQRTWNLFLKALRQFIKENHFKHKFVALYIEHLVLQASIAKPKHQELYIRVIEHSLNIYKPFIHRPTYDYLQQELKGLKGHTDQ